MPEDITLNQALFAMIQRIEDKIDHVKDDLSAVKAKQAVIEAAVSDHVDSSHSNNSKSSLLESIPSLKILVPIILSIFIAGRMSVSMLNAPAPQYNTPTAQVDGTYIHRNRIFDSILSAEYAKFK